MEAPCVAPAAAPNCGVAGEKRVVERHWELLERKPLLDQLPAAAAALPLSNGSLGIRGGVAERLKSVAEKREVSLTHLGVPI